MITGKTKPERWRHDSGTPFAFKTPESGGHNTWGGNVQERRRYGLVEHNLAGKSLGSSIIMMVKRTDGGQHWTKDHTKVLQ